MNHDIGTATRKLILDLLSEPPAPLVADPGTREEVAFRLDDPGYHFTRTSYSAPGVGTVGTIEVWWRDGLSKAPARRVEVSVTARLLRSQEHRRAWGAAVEALGKLGEALGEALGEEGHTPVPRGQQATFGVYREPTGDDTATTPTEYRGWARIDSGDAIITEVHGSYTLARESLENLARARGWTLRWFDGEVTLRRRFGGR